MKPNLNDLAAFVIVAREGSFTRAAAQLGVSQSALSQTIRSLEERLGVRLFTRTTRRVAPTDAGDRLLAEIAPRLEGIEGALAALSDMRDKPAGSLRITASEHATDSILMPKLTKLLRAYPDIKVEISTDYRMVDIVEMRFDAGVRLGESLAKDMIAVRIGPDVRMAVVGAPSYFARHPIPAAPQELTEHDCINVRLPTHGGLLPWDFKRGSQELNVRVEGTLIFSGFPQVLKAALDGMGLAFILEEVVQKHIDAGALVRVLDDWCHVFPGYHLYYPSRRQPSPAFTLLVDALRYER
ncbi:LysR family transcriptional regulator [Pseudoduganella umbonata]|uniref:DNA-binding transcriptional LysR family regulator n=1 Tax=Pseudoduganella umbonata TaxID=864828 RepID=A0A4P8HLD6_9BURK|nr:LysR family transcriptional regulator [Pseudoduganella umbonata]MBB3221661.1 DNA-binding transcriptional LysR family regulator [Pseudoduganella umbonata]QCP09112.1 LysR family transcriptional regulator [Pseudoduganella umbonata]